jgi:hypothetical protein
MANGSEVNPLQAARISVKRYLENNWKVLLAVITIQAIVYSYLFTGITFTDHTLGHSKILTYPSYITKTEGRWMQDILINLQGGSGNQSVQMIIAAMLQAVNGTLFAHWLNLKRQFHVFLIAALLCLFPPFLDYYGFPRDNFNFVFGDTLCILGAYLLKRGTLISALSSSLFYWLSLSIYQPKIALVALTAIGCIILRATEENTGKRTIGNWQLLKEFSLPSLSIAIALTFYWLSYKFFAVDSYGNYTHINNLEEIITELSKAYSKTLQYFSGDIGGLPLNLRFLPLIIIAAGASRAVAIVMHTKGKLAAFMVGISILLGPAAINATWIINREAWLSPGRMYTAYAYFFVLFLSFLLLWKFLQRIAEITALTISYFLFILASQQANALEIRNAYEISFINRIVHRVETLIPAPTATGTKPALVVVGEIPNFEFSRHVRFPPKFGVSHALNYWTFATYNHVDMINFFLGRDAVRAPTNSEKQEVIDESSNVQPWPNQQATFISPSKAIGVVLEKHRPGGSVTWHDKQQRP